MQRLRWYFVELLLIGTLLASVAFFAYLGYGLARPNVVNESFSGQKALASVNRQLAFGARITGTDASLQTGDWLIEQLRLLGWDVVIQPFTINEQVQARNIIAIRSPERAGAPVVMLTTHYDTRLAADLDSDELRHQEPVPGANDGASGPAVLLELARTLDVGAVGHTICLAFFDAEANGGVPGWDMNIGSQIFVDSQPASIPRCAAPRVLVNIDLVGAIEQRFFQNEEGDEVLNGAIWQMAANLDLDSRFPAQTRSMPPATSAAFRASGTAVADIVGADYPYRATLADTADKLSAETLSSVGLVLETWLESSP